MNDAQTSLMRWLDSEWTKHQRAEGKPCDRDARLAFYFQVTGRSVTSSKLLRNDDITAIKRRVLALRQPDNFNAQMKSQEDNDPAVIRDRYRQRIESALFALKPDTDFREPGIADHRRAEYWTGTARRMFGVAVHELTNDQLRQLAGLFERRARSRAERDQEKALRYAEAVGEASDRNPF